MEMIGNILFFKKTNSFVSRIIAKITGGEFTHVGLIVAYDPMTNIATIVESDRFVDTKVSRVQLNDGHVVYSADMSDETRKKIVKYAFESLGEKYDYLQVFGLFLSLLFKGDRHAIFNSSNKLICSELIDLAYYKAGVKRRNPFDIGNITPQELLEAYDLKEVRKEV
jgi:hypothetical protein